MFAIDRLCLRLILVCGLFCCANKGRFLQKNGAKSQPNIIKSFHVLISCKTWRTDMNLESHEAAVEFAPRVISIAKREQQICQASKAAEAAFEQISCMAADNLLVRAEMQGRVFSIFRWYFLSAFCTRLLTDAAHRLEHQTLQVSIDIFSAVKMVLTDSEIERSMALVGAERTSPALARANDIGCRGHTVGWVAAGLHEKGHDLPPEIQNALAGALAASARIN
ncbi:hypothetical protein [Ruegeria atlantica]|uniref:hypothetical protein n=1 Tax=Ruegeria atlantica TaxID=81569 RepID=UPI0014805A31|nr:hypothetical protein [Ruegeria atlantica]